MLVFNNDWRFDSPGEISKEVFEQFWILISRCAVPNRRKYVYEHFKDYFGAAAGSTVCSSSSADWAETDLRSFMTDAAANAPLFIEAFYDACQSLGEGAARPTVAIINRALQKANSGWEIKLPDLVRMGELIPKPVAVRGDTRSLDEHARELIQESLSKSEKFLAAGENRQAVAEILWLLETVSTTFQGVHTAGGTITGHYFNRIVADLRKYQKGTTLERVLEWIMSLHGYLSSPTGGGVRHGRNIKHEQDEMAPEEARLFCNLIRSYINFLVTEHRRLGSMR